MKRRYEAAGLLPKRDREPKNVVQLINMNKFIPNKQQQQIINSTADKQAFVVLFNTITKKSEHLCDWCHNWFEYEGETLLCQKKGCTKGICIKCNLEGQDNIISDECSYILLYNTKKEMSHFYCRKHFKRSGKKDEEK